MVHSVARFFVMIFCIGVIVMLFAKIHFCNLII